jgi:hypothetical protein
MLPRDEGTELPGVRHDAQASLEQFEILVARHTLQQCRQNTSLNMGDHACHGKLFFSSRASTSLPNPRVRARAGRRPARTMTMHRARHGEGVTDL